MTAEDYQKFATQCIEWASETEDPEAEEQFLSLAADWILALIAVRKAEELDSNVIAFRDDARSPVRRASPAAAP